MTAAPLSADISIAAFDALHDEPAAWRAPIESIAAEHSPHAVQQVSEGTVLVALLGTGQVIKLYPPFLHNHFDYECAALQLLAGRLRVPTPSLVATGQRDGWPYLVMTQLPGQGLVPVWPTLSAAQQCTLLHELGALAAEVHALPTVALKGVSLAWPAFITEQRARCLARQQRTGLPAHLLQQLGVFLQGPLPTGPDCVLTGEYTPMNLLAQGAQLVGMFDFGDGLLGPREYDWLGPLAFLAAGNQALCQAFFEGYGVLPDTAQRQALMRLLLLHRYSNLPAQLALPGWQQAQSFEALSALLWP